MLTLIGRAWESRFYSGDNNMEEVECVPKKQVSGRRATLSKSLRLDIWAESEGHTREEAWGDSEAAEGREELLISGGYWTIGQLANVQPLWRWNHERRGHQSYKMLLAIKSLGKGYDRICFQETKVILFDGNRKCGGEEGRGLLSRVHTA